MHRDGKKELKRLETLLIKRYFERTILEEALTTVDYDPNIHVNMEFLRLGDAVRWDENPLSDSTVFLDLLFEQEADNLVLGEKKHLVDSIIANKNIVPQHLDELSYDSLVDAIRAKFSISKPSVIYMPLALSRKVRLEWNRKGKSFLITHNYFRIIAPDYDENPLLVWSNKYMPFNSIIVANKTFGQWVARPNRKERVKVNFNEASTVLSVYSTFHFSLLKPEEVLRIDLNPEDLENEMEKVQKDITGNR